MALKAERVEVSAEKKTKIVVAEDHAIIREALVRHLEATGRFEVLGQAGTGEEARELILSLQPTLALTDISMPKGSGLWVARECLKAQSPTRFVILASMIEESVLADARKLGIFGVVQKSEPTEILLDAVAAALDGDFYLSPQLSRGKDKAGLSPREQDVLRLMCEGLTSGQIGTALGVSSRTVEAHRRTLMTKVGAESVAEVIRYAVRTGFLLP